MMTRATCPELAAWTEKVGKASTRETRVCFQMDKDEINRIRS